MLLSITKLQNLKAIHNELGRGEEIIEVVINRKTTKFESNSQHKLLRIHWFVGCYQSQNYKIWKQFTTTCFKSSTTFWLLSITKLQNLKAIHNSDWNIPQYLELLSITKFESNSQLICPSCFVFICCYQSQNYKIWKQFTT